MTRPIKFRAWEKKEKKWVGEGMIRTIRNIIADHLVSVAIALYTGELRVSLAQWVVDNFPNVRETKENKQHED
jgi:hypothetical protein